ncbi:MAG: hypothetical protein IKE69_04725 [Thermoguttaceae bacterium]|nr:hypothetical protein [Thermoguttaceae bacterium]
MNWFYVDVNGHKRGPYNDRQVEKLISRGTVTSSTVILDEQGNQSNRRFFNFGFQDDRPVAKTENDYDPQNDGSTYDIQSDGSNNNDDYNPFEDTEFGFDNDEAVYGFDDWEDPVPVPYTNSHDDYEDTSVPNKSGGSGFWSEFFANLLVGIGLTMLFDAILDVIFGRRRY